MSRVVGGIVVPHDPLMFVMRDRVSPDVRERVDAAYRSVSEQVRAWDPTSVIVFGTDHYILFGPQCLPQVAIATGELDGPADQLPGFERRLIPHAPELARHLVRHLHAHQVDAAVARTLTVDHSIAIPHRLVVDLVSSELPIVPIYLACGVEPVIPIARARTIGEQIAAAVASMPGDERVVVIGSGGISHAVGTAEMGRVNSQFDHWVLDSLGRGDLDALTDRPDEEVVAEAGNGALEIRTFVAAASAVAAGDDTGAFFAQTVDYLPVPEWITGLGFAVLHPASVDTPAALVPQGAPS